MVEIRTRYDGGLRCSAEHGPSKSALVTDAPIDNHGRGEAFSPTDLLATALATCMLTTMAIVAERQGVELAGGTARVEKHMVADPVRRVGKLVVELKLPHVAEEHRARLESAAHRCPVTNSLHPETELEVTFAWGS